MKLTIPFEKSYHPKHPVKHSLFGKMQEVRYIYYPRLNK